MTCLRVSPSLVRHAASPAASAGPLRLAAAFLGAGFTLLSAGCAPAGPSRAEASVHSTPRPDPADPGAPFAYPADDYFEHEAGRAGGTLRVSVAADTGTLDFQLITNTNAKWLGRLIYDNLVYLDERGVPQPWLAASWTVSPDGLTYVFKLRHGVTFSDGTPFDAHAVLENLRRMRDPATKAAMTTAYLAPYRDGVVLDDYTFQANLSEPYTPFLNVLAQSWLGLVSPKALRENPKALAEHPVGTGPFTVQRYARQEGITFVRRADYDWAPPFLRHHGPAYLDRIEVTFVPEALIRYTSLVSREYDFTIDAPPQNAAALRANPDYVFVSRVNLGNPSRAITFNVEKPPFDDVRVRRAFALAVDREGLARIIGFGEYRLKTDFLSATTRYYDPSFRSVLAFDPAAANRLLDEAGWTGRDPDGIRTRQGVRLFAEILATEAASPSPLVVALQSDLRRAGFDLRIVQLPLTQITARRNANDYQALTAGFWHTNTPDGLYIVYHGLQITSDRYIGQNTSRLDDPVLNDLLSRARRSADDAELRRLYSAAQQRLTELVPAVPVFENHTLVTFHRDVRGVVFDTSHNTPFFTTAWLDRPAR